VALMDQLGLERAALLGHDRGARVTYRLALDHPGRISRLGIIEIAPTSDYWAAWSAEMGLAAYHWTFLAQPAPLFEFVNHAVRGRQRQLGAGRNAGHGERTARALEGTEHGERA
jgi:pimeloyl-ACP methyl ester carboxylesterase